MSKVTFASVEFWDIPTLYFQPPIWVENPSIRAHYDGEADTLYLIYKGEQTWNSRPCLRDCGLIVDYNRASEAIGIRLLCASERSLEGWRNHPDRDQVPTPLYDAAASWVQHRGRNHA